MAYVKFVKGLVSQYTNGKASYDTNGSIFFATDDDLIFVNGRTYGISKAEKQKLAKSIKTVEILPVVTGDASLKLKITYTDDTTSNVEIPAVTDSRNGLMTPTQKGNLESVYRQVITGGSDTIKNQILENKVSSSDKTITVTPGGTDISDPTKITGTNLAVNIDGTTIVKDANTGALSVASAALVQYKGDNKTIDVSAVDSETNSKTISFTGSIVEVPAADLGNATVKTAYELRDKDGDPIGARIVIPKDNSFVNGKMGKMGDTINETSGVITPYEGADADKSKAALELIYINGEGKYILVQVDIEEYLKEAEFKDGLLVDNHEVSVKLSTNTESAKYLKIQAVSGANGAIELSGIDAAIAAASSSIAEKATGHVTVSSTSDANGTVYTISESDIASDAALTAEETRAKSAETAIDAEIGLTKDASGEGRTYSNTGTYIGKDATKNTVAKDIKALDTAVAGLDNNAVKNVTVNGRNATVTNNTAVVEVDGGDIKVDKDGTATDPINTGGSITKGTTLEAAIQALEAQLLWYEAND